MIIKDVVLKKQLSSNAKRPKSQKGLVKKMLDTNMGLNMYGGFRGV